MFTISSVESVSSIVGFLLFEAIKKRKVDRPRTIWLDQFGRDAVRLGASSWWTVAVERHGWREFLLEGPDWAVEPKMYVSMYQRISHASQS